MKAYVFIPILFFALLAQFKIGCGVYPMFSSTESLSQQLISHIDHAKKSISAAIYMLTDENVTNALIKAHNRGVNVHIVIDAGTYYCKANQTQILEKSSVPVYLYCPDINYFETISSKKGSYSPRPLMHHKFLILDYKYVWNGSYNCTWRADHWNRENANIYYNEPGTLQSYINEFYILIQHSIRL